MKRPARWRWWTVALPVAVVVTAAGVGLTRPSSPEPPPELAVRAALLQFEHAVESRDLRAALQVVSPSFEGQFVSWNRAAEVLRRMSQDFLWLTIHVADVEITVAPDGRTADAVIWASFVGRTHNLTYEYGQGEPVRMEASFAKEGRRWRAVSMRGVPLVYGYRS